MPKTVEHEFSHNKLFFSLKKHHFTKEKKPIHRRMLRRIVGSLCIQVSSNLSPSYCFDTWNSKGLVHLPKEAGLGRFFKATCLWDLFPRMSFRNPLLILTTWLWNENIILVIGTSQWILRISKYGIRSDTRWHEYCKFWILTLLFAHQRKGIASHLKFLKMIGHLKEKHRHNLLPVWNRSSWAAIVLNGDAWQAESRTHWAMKSLGQVMSGGMCGSLYATVSRWWCIWHI